MRSASSSAGSRERPGRRRHQRIPYRPSTHAAGQHTSLSHSEELHGVDADLEEPPWQITETIRGTAPDLTQPMRADLYVG